MSMDPFMIVGNNKCEIQKLIESQNTLAAKIKNIDECKQNIDETIKFADQITTTLSIFQATQDFRTKMIYSFVDDLKNTIAELRNQIEKMDSEIRELIQPNLD